MLLPSNVQDPQAISSLESEQSGLKLHTFAIGICVPSLLQLNTGNENNAPYSNNGFI